MEKQNRFKEIYNKDSIKTKIQTLYFEFIQQYGSPRITAESQALGYQISRIAVAKYMKELYLKKIKWTLLIPILSI